jgi:hypothetical protein
MNRPPPVIPPSSETSQRRFPLAICIALVLGVVLYITLPPGPAGQHARTATWRWVTAIAVALFALLPPIHRIIFRGMEKVRHPSAGARWKIAVIVALVAAGYFLLTALNQDRDFFAKTHDECAYLIQTQMLARGKLWMPAHPLHDFFDTFYVLTTPKYVAITFPGSAMFFVFALWLHLPTSAIPILLSGALVGLTYRIITELTDGVGGLLAAILVCSLSWFRMISVMLMSQVPVLFLGLVVIWAYLRYRRVRGRFRPSIKWLLLIGAGAGWAAITRPIDALVLVAPVGIALLFDLWRTSWPTHVGSVALPILAAIPFLAVQAAINRGVTGSFLKSPAQINLNRDTPGGTYGFHTPPPNAHPQSVVRQKQIDYEIWAVPVIASHRPKLIPHTWWTTRFPLMADVTLPSRVLLILLPLGLLGVRGLRWLLFCTLPLFILGYIGWAFFLEHYNVTIIPAVALLLVLSVRQLHLIRPSLASAAIAFVLVLALTDCWEFNHAVSDEPFRATWLRELHNTSERNAIILFKFDFDANTPDIKQFISQEPVFNTDVAWPDDASVIRAHDLGSRDIELFRYYAARSPDRKVYLFSRSTGQVQDLGLVKDLAGR